MGNQNVVQRFVEALAERNHEGVADCFAGDIQFRALIPPGLTEAAGSAEATALFMSWWGDSDRFRLISSSSEGIADKTRVTYTIQGREAGEWYACQQQAFCIVNDDKMATLDILCSGFRPIPKLGWA